jgi:proteasome lid subunit RPN8/RPN11
MRPNPDRGFRLPIPDLTAVLCDLEVKQSALDEIVAHAREEAPRECCGMLVGTEERIERAVRARNLLRSNTRFLMDPRDQIAVMRESRGSGQSVVGFYHSHPASPPVPSETDTAEAAYSGYFYLIVSLEAGTCAVEAFRLQEQAEFLPVRLVPIA